jgi:carbon monoxide dehydrogenase subunit G
MQRAWFSGLFVSVVAAQADAGPISLVERPGHITEATVTVDASPAEVYSLVTDYANWRQIFTDVESVSVKSGDREGAEVRFKSRTIDYTVTVKFDNVPNQAIRFRGIKGPPGGKARGEYILTPLDGGARTQVTARFFLDVDGPAALFVREKKLRGIRRAKLTADLTDAQRQLVSAR